MSDNAARTQRSVPGMIGAMLVLLLVIGLFVAARSFTRDNVEMPPTPVDYLAAVAGAQDLGLTVIYPAELPADWVVTSVVLPRSAGQPWGLGLVTADKRFVALRQAPGSQSQVARAEMGAQALVEDPVEVPGSRITGWRRVTSRDETGLVAPRPGGAVLVYGTADPSAIKELVGVLTDRRLETR